jgi:hypothetical protein
VRSIPEKTLEHWTSIYLSNRFSDGALWWPSSGEDVLLELPRLAATGPGKTIALELKTTEATQNRHVLEIDTHQLDRYLHPPVGPPLPIYYVFPVPHWTGALTSTTGMAPPRPTSATTAPPAWWRQRTRPAWFGEWVYVMSAQCVSQALPANWRSKNRATLFTIDAGRPAHWTTLFARSPSAEPRPWKKFWSVVTSCGPLDGVRWLTLVDDNGLVDRVLVLDSNRQEQVWPIGRMVDQAPGNLREADTSVALRRPGDDSAARAILHVPASALKDPMVSPVVRRR